MLTSPVLVQQAVLDTGLNATVIGASSASPRYWQWRFLDGADTTAFSPHPRNLQALYANFDDQSISQEKYKIRFGKAGDYQILSDGSVVLNGHLGKPASGGGLQLLLMAQEKGFVPQAGANYGLKIVSPVIVAQNILNGQLSVTPGGTPTLPSDIINVNFASENPYQGQRFVNALMSDYIGTIVSWNSTAAGGVVNFITDQLSDVQARLAKANAALAQYQQKTGILSPPDNAKDIIDQQSQFAVEQARLKIKLAAFQEMNAALHKPIHGIDPYLLSQTTNVTLSDLSEKLADAYDQLEALRVDYTDNAPQVQAQLRRVWQLQYAIRSLVGNKLRETQNNLATNTALINKLQDKIEAMPAQSLRVISLTRSSDVLGQLYVMLMQKQQEAALSKAAQVSATRVLTPAQLPFKPSAPRPAVVLAFSLVLGLLAGIAWVLGRRALSGRFETETEIRRLVKLPVYGMVPERAPADAATLLATHGYGAFAESFRVIRNNIYHAIPGKQCKTILLTSAGISEGKSSVAANLAKTMADDGKRVLLIDADMRKGHLDSSLGLKASPGLSDWLISSESVPLQIPAGERFSVLTSGVKPPNPAELLNEGRLHEILRTLSPAYDFIIFDSVPLPLVSDALILARHADLTLSVLYQGRSKHREVALHAQTLEPLTTHIGLIINAAGRAKSGYGMMMNAAPEASVKASAPRREEPALTS